MSAEVRGLRRAIVAMIVVVGAIATLATPPARADRREASLHAHLLGGVLVTGDVDGGDARARVPLAGVALRAGYATHDAYQYDLAIAFARAGEASFASRTFSPAGRPPVTGPYRVGTLLARADGGVTLRLGVRWIPTVRLAAGAQLRRLGEAQVDTAAGTVTGRAAALAFDLIGAAALGLDHRIHRRLIVGVAAGATIALPLGGPPVHTLELTAHAAYYWYPRW
jgi:hypothetical protein